MTPRVETPPPIAGPSSARDLDRVATPSVTRSPSCAPAPNSGATTSCASYPRSATPPASDSAPVPPIESTPLASPVLQDDHQNVPVIQKTIPALLVAPVVSNDTSESSLDSPTSAPGPTGNSNDRNDSRDADKVPLIPRTTTSAKAKGKKAQTKKVTAK